MTVWLQKTQQIVPADQTYFQQCHASSLVVLPGKENLLVAYFAGTKEGCGDTAIWLSRCVEGNWLPPKRIMAEDGLAHWNPVLHYQHHRLWLFYKVGADVHHWVTRWSMSDDGGLTWREPAELVVGDNTPRGPVKNKLLVMSNGEWIAPSSTETPHFWDAFVDISADKGNSWQSVAIPLAHHSSHKTEDSVLWQGLQNDALWECDLTQVMAWDGVIQPTLWESKPGYIHAMMRSTRGYVYRADSCDFGRSWSEAYATQLPNNNSGIDVVQMDNGSLILACNPVSGNWGHRYPLALLHSQDNGNNWSHLWDLSDGQGEYSYPAIIQQGGMIHLSWTIDRQNIMYQQLTTT